MADTLRVKEAPSRVEKLPVVKSVFLGWLGNFGSTPGYFAYVLTYGRRHDDKPERYEGHVMRATALDGRWLRIESAWNMDRNEALAAFDKHSELAAWPEGN